MKINSSPIFRSAILSLAVIASGCASLVSGSNQEMSFNSNPDGALVTVNGREIGKTPVVIQLKRGEAKPVVFSKDGYKSVSMQIDSEINGWFWGNIISAGFYGSTTDGLTGAMRKYAPNQFMVTLSPLTASAAPIDRSTGLSENQKLKDFVVVSYHHLRSDLSKGSGDYLKSLLSLLKTATSDIEPTIKKIRGLAEAYPTIPEFAERVMDLASNNTAAPTASSAGSVPTPKSHAQRTPQVLECASMKTASSEQMYDSFSSYSRESVDPCRDSISDSQKSKLTAFILQQKGKATFSDSRFELASDLSGRDKEFVAWYVKKYTNLTPNQQ